MGQRIVGRSDVGNVLIIREDTTIQVEGHGRVPDRTAPLVRMRIGVDTDRNGRADVVLAVEGAPEPGGLASASIVSPHYHMLSDSPLLGRVLLNAGLRHDNGVLDEHTTREIVGYARNAIRDASVLHHDGRGNP